MKKIYLILTICIGLGFSSFSQCNSDFDSNPDPACIGSPVIFYDLSTGGSPAFTWSWNFGAGATPATFFGQNPPAVTYSTPGTKNITLTYTSNSGGCSDVQTRQIDIIPQPTASFTSNAPQCVSSLVNFTYTGSATLTYQWDFGVGATPSMSVVPNPMGIMYSSAGTKTITLTIDNGTCTRTITQNITINATPLSTFSSTAPQCSGLPVDFTNTGTTTGVSYSWNLGAGATPATSLLQDPTGVIYSSAGTKVITLTTTDNTTACASTTTQTININQTPTSTFTSNAPQCVNSLINYTNTGSTGGSWSYFWDFGADASPQTSTSENPTGIAYSTGGTKSITLSISNGSCTQTSTQTVNINTLPIANAGLDTTICANTSVQIGSTPIAGYTYNWFPSSTLSNAAIANPIANPIAPITTYFVTMTNTLTGCVGKDSIVVTMLSPLVADAGVDVEICRYDSIQIGAGLIEGQTYVWTASAGLNGISSSNTLASPSTTTTYTLTVTGSGCAAVTDEVTVIVHQLPIVSAGVDDTITVGSSVQLTATGGVQYTWMPSYGLSNIGVFNPVANPDTSTTYIVSAIDIYGCMNSDTILVRVIAPSFWIATAFTPDNNGHNDVLFVRGEGINNFEFAVFDRWGEQLFYTKDLKTGWDGTKQGTGLSMPEGAYAYFVKGELSNGDPVSAKGIVNLIR